MEKICEINSSVKLEQITFCNFKLNFFNKEIVLSFPQLLQLRNKLNELTSPLQLTNIIDNENFVLLFVADKKHLLFLEIPNLLFLKDEVDSFFSVSI